VKYFSIIFFLVLSTIVFPQNWLKVDSIFTTSGVTVKSFSCPFFADIDNNGTKDLFLGNNTDMIDYFSNNTMLFPSTFTKDNSIIANIYSGGLINTNSDYPALHDLDVDTDLDLIIGGFYGLLYYENKGSETNPDFVKVDTVFSNVNPLIGGDPKPAFADLDNDGDLDLLVGIGESLLGGPDPGLTLGFRNIGTSTAPKFLADNSLATGIPDVGLNSYPALADIDNDSDYDLLIGRDGAAIHYYKNNGTPSQPVWIRENNTFAIVETSTYWKNPTFVDLDYDNDFDLVYGQSTGILYVYRNNGTLINPLYQYYPDYFKVIKLDGSGATVSLADYDNDGDFDLLSGMWDGKFYYFTNNGTNLKPQFTRVSTSFSNLSVNSYSSPVFIDFDRDGDYDIISGALDGKVYLFINNNGTFTANNSIFGFIDVGWMSSPSIVDIDGDGDLDLLVAAETGTETKFFENTGNNNFVQNNVIFSGISFPSYSSATLSDIDNDWDYDLIIGRSNGALFFYRNDGNSNIPIWNRIDTLFGGVKVKQNANTDFADLDGDGRKDVIVGEYDGNFTYFKNLFAQPNSIEEEISNPVDNFILFQNYPNPISANGGSASGVNSSTTISWQSPVGSRQTIKLYNTLGEEIETIVDGYYEAGKHSTFYIINSTLPSGVYFYQLRIGDYSKGSFGVQTKKMILMR